VKFPLHAAFALHYTEFQHKNNLCDHKAWEDDMTRDFRAFHWYAACVAAAMLASTPLSAQEV